MGNRTFGKGSVQSVVPLSESAGLKLTTALYYTPNGTSIQVTGVEPNIVVDDTAAGNLFRLPREGDLKRHLLNSTIEETSTEDTEQAEIPDEIKMFELGGADDYQLKQAVNFLDGKPVQRTDPVLAAQLREQAQAAQAKAEADGTATPKPAVKGEHFRVTPQGLETVPGK